MLSLDKIRTQAITAQYHVNLFYLLGVGLFYQRAPELIAVVRMAVNQMAVVGGQPIINDHIHPLSKTPKAKVEDTSVCFWFVLFPFLVLPVWNHLTEKECKLFLKKSVLTASFRPSDTYDCYKRLTDKQRNSSQTYHVLPPDLTDFIKVMFTHLHHT